MISDPSSAERDLSAAIVANPAALEMRDAPINPEWVLEGAPAARCAGHSENHDGWASTAVWDCTAGKFRWFFGWEETVVILEGAVRVTDARGNTTTLNAGDIGYFPHGTWFTWEIDQYVRKIAFCRSPVPAKIRQGINAYRWARALPMRIIRRVARA